MRENVVIYKQDYMYGFAIDYHTDEKGLLEIVFV
jgi:hypothetical protein